MKKQCTECGSEFRTPSAHRYTCSKRCYKNHWTKYRQTDEMKKKREDWKLSNGRYTVLKKRVKEKGFSYIMDNKVYFRIIKQNCWYCNFKHWGVEKGVGLDRLDNTVEYLESNVVSCCGKCSRSRSDVHAPEVFRDMMRSAKYIRALKVR